MIKLDLSNALNSSELTKYQPKITKINEMIINGTGLGNEFLGWVTWPTDYNFNEYQAMKKNAEKMQAQIDYLVVIGIGGSYLGTRSAVEMINGLYNQKQKVKLLYLGNTMSATYTKQILDFLQDKKFGIVVVSKSGTTTEPAIAFVLAKDLLEKNVGKAAASKLIVIVTDKEKGILISLAKNENYACYIIPDNIGGRYSVLTPVGIFPMLIAGIDCEQVFKGAQEAQKNTATNSIEKNNAFMYAAARYYFYKEKSYKAEMLISYEMQMQMFSEWWKQLFGESEGKDHKGLLPISCLFSTDLHSMGQYIQDGPHNLFFETVLKVKTQTENIFVKKDESFQELNYLFNRNLSDINDIAFESVLKAHSKVANIPNIIITINQMDAYNFGYLSYWFMKACAMSSYLLEINPFNQPGVEVYKKTMLTILKKIG